MSSNTEVPNTQQNTENNAHTYKNNFWGGNNEILNQREITFSIFDSLQCFFYELSLIEQSYSQNLLNAMEILDAIKEGLNYKHPKHILELIDKTKNFLGSYSGIHLKLSEELTNRIESEKIFFKGIKNKNMEFISRNYTIAQNFDSVIQGLENKKREFYDSIIEVEKIKLNDLNAVNVPASEKNKIKDSLTEKIEAAKKNSSTYLIEINKANQKREEHIDLNNKLLDEFYSFDISFLKKVKENLCQQINIYSWAENKKLLLIKEIQDELGKTNGSNEEEEFIKDIEDFIEENKTYVLPPPKFDYLAFSSKPENNKPFLTLNPGLDKSKLSSLSNYIKNEFTYQYPEIYSENEESNLEYKEVLRLAQISLEGREDSNKFFEENSSFIDKMVKEKNLCEFYLRYLNKRRAAIKDVKENGFNILSQIFKKILDTYSAYSSNFNPFIINFIVILSQTFFYIPTAADVHDKSILVMESLKSNAVWQDKESWIQMVQQHIDIELNKHKFSTSNATQKEKNEKIYNSVTSSLLTFKFNMDNFGLLALKENEVINFYLEKYKIPESNRQTLQEQILQCQANNEEEKLKEAKKEEVKEENKEEAKEENKEGEGENKEENKEEHKEGEPLNKEDKKEENKEEVKENTNINEGQENNPPKEEDLFTDSPENNLEENVVNEGKTEEVEENKTQ
ncbi:MAG: hypothetical protein MJ252_25890 [archaeon]|nr:hypothetical protein [archaeon]